VSQTEKTMNESLFTQYDGYDDQYGDLDISTIVGKTLIAVNVVESHTGDDHIMMKFDDGTYYKMFHEQDCTEYVQIESIDVSLQHLIGSPILVAEQRSTSDGDTDHYAKDGTDPDSSTWTFYRISNIRSTSVLRWYGMSNGYYSERVSFVRMILKP